MKLLKTINKGSAVTYKQKKLKRGKAYKYVVRAYKIVDGTKITLSVSKTVHVYISGGKYGNTKSVMLNKTKIAIKKGDTFTIKAKQVKEKNALKNHRAICFESSNTKVAAVTKAGRIIAKAKGKCTIYVYAQNGIFKQIKVSVYE